MSEITLKRYVAPACRWTFKIKPIANLLKYYVGDGIGWLDPFAGELSMAEFTNDLNPARNAKYHMYADEFIKSMDGVYKGILFDPPYSYRQVSDCYKDAGFKASQLDTSYNFYNRVMNAAADKIEMGGLAISFGWNSNGFGVNRGYRLIDGIIIAHGQHRNDTICVVEQRVTERIIKVKKNA